MRDSVRDSARLAGHVDLLLAVFAAAVALGINLLVGHLLFEPRPFVANPAAVHKLIPYAADASFPSDHTAIAFAIVFVLIAAAIRLTRNRAAGLLAFVIAFLALLAAMVIAFARVYVGVHYPGDVLGGAVCGALGATIALALRPLLAPLLTSAVGALGRIGLA
jgi:undecaprenyl-diphosphatase